MKISSSQLLEKRVDVKPEIVLELCKMVKEHFEKLPNVYDIKNIPDSGVCVVGDLHGSDQDLIKILKFHGLGDKTYLFLGDYVDRGFFALRILIILFTLILEGMNIHMCRGNHETRRMSGYFGFAEECKRTYGNEKGEEIRTAMLEVFRYLPLAGVIGGKIFCVHAGISESMKLVSDVNKIERKTVDLFGDEVDYFAEKPMIIADLLWSDPRDDGLMGYRRNEMRGCGYFFGQDATERFLDDNGLMMIIRSHEFTQLGRKYNHNFKVLTIFSCGDYCLRDNKGTVAMVSKDFSVKVVEYEKAVIELQKKQEKQEKEEKEEKSGEWL